MLDPYRTVIVPRMFPLDRLAADLREKRAGSIEASDLRLNGYPPVIELERALYAYEGVERDPEGEVTAAIYRTSGGRVLTVWND